MRVVENVSGGIRCAALLAIVGVLTGCRSGSDDVEQLVAASGGYRPGDGWLSTITQHHPRRPSPPTFRSASDLAPGIVEIYARLADVGTDGRRESRLLQASAAELAVGRLQAAEARVTEALAYSATSWAAWNDLAVIRLTRSGEAGEDAAEEISRAVDAAMRAAELAPDRPQVWFNLSLALSRVQLRTQSVVAFERLRGLKTQSGWSDELQPTKVSSGSAGSTWEKSRAAILDVNTRSDHAADASWFPGQAREFLLLELFPAWAQALRDGRVREAQVLGDRAETIARTLSQIDGDALHLECANELDRAAAGKMPATQSAALFNAHIEHAEGRRLYELNQRAAAQDRFRRAAAEWARGSSPCRGWTDLDQAVALYQAGQPAAALERYSRVAASASRKNFHSLLARTHWLRGAALLAGGEVERAQQAYRDAIALYEKSKDNWNLISIRNTAADGLRELGAHPYGWQYLSPALARLDTVSEVRRRYLILYNASLYTGDAGLPHAALAFQEAALEQAYARGAPNTIVEGLIQRGRRHLSLDRPAAAVKDLDEAARLVPTIEASSSAAYLGAWLTRVRAELLAPTKPAQALELVNDQLIAYFQKREMTVVPALYRIRARAALAANRLAEANASLSEGIAVFEQMYGTLAASHFRASYLDSAWDLFGDLIALRATRAQDPAAAFAVAERARARGPDRLDLNVSPETIARRLPVHTGLIYYVALEDRLLVWRIGAGRQEFESVPLRRTELRYLVAGYRQLIEAGAAKADLLQLGSRLYQALLNRRWLEEARVSRLLLVPDDALHALPFSALIEPGSRRYAVEDLRLELVSSGQALARALPHNLASGPVVAKLLAVSASSVAGHAKLPEADREVEELAKYYPDRQVLSGPASTPTELGRRISNFEIVHFAGHAQTDLMFPWSSYLVLFPDAAHPDGLLKVEEIETWRLPKTRLVILSACQTAVGAVFRGDGMVTLARPFLNGGVKTVVGSLWRVDDRSTRQVFTTFHDRFAAERVAGTALHAAQLSLLRSSDPTSQLAKSWSGFVVIGAGDQP